MWGMCTPFMTSPMYFSFLYNVIHKCRFLIMFCSIWGKRTRFLRSSEDRKSWLMKSFCYIFNMASLGLKKMYLIIYHLIDGTRVVQVIFHSKLWNRTRIYCGRWGVIILAKVYLEEATSVKTFRWYPRTEIPSSRKVRWFTGTDVMGKTVIRNPLRSHKEHLKTGLRNIWRLPHQSVTILTPQVTPRLLTIFSIFWRKEHILARSIKEAIFIGVNDPFLNRNIDKYHLPHI